MDKILKSKNITKRLKNLSEYLNSNAIGQLNEKESEKFTELYDLYYTPDGSENKIKIETVSIEYSEWMKKQFRLNDNLSDSCTCSIKRLAGGSKPSFELMRNRAFRQAIEEQILDFRKKNKLDKKKYGDDAEVDHIIPFNILVKEYLECSNNVSFKYNKSITNYELDECCKKDWQMFHLYNAQLQYLSRKDNSISYLSYKK